MFYFLSLDWLVGGWGMAICPKRFACSQRLEGKKKFFIQTYFKNIIKEKTCVCAAVCKTEIYISEASFDFKLAKYKGESGYLWNVSN